jgi:hypothetical protein
MTSHQFLAFMAESHKHYGFWPGYELMARNLRLNTPRGQARWDAQLRKTLKGLLSDGLVEWMPCPAGASVRGAPCRHIVLTELGAQTLRAWDEVGCRSHGRSKGRCTRSEAILMPGLEHAA